MSIQLKIRVNTEIRISQIRLIGPNGEQIGIISTQEGLRLAGEAGLDLVEVAPQAAPPVCRIMNFSKFKYEQEKREREARKKQHVVHTKEIKLKPNIEEHDYQTKLNHLKRFINSKDKVKVSMMFRGREMSHMEIGKAVIERLIKDASDIAEVEKFPKLEGHSMIMYLSPK